LGEEMERRGIFVAGIWVVDYIKIINKWPEQNMAAYILEESKSVGGGPYNVLACLDQMECNFPLYAAGLIGNDDKGDYIRSEVQKLNINTDLLNSIERFSTSYSDVMSVEKTGSRTFFHDKGANSAFGISDIEKIKTGAKIFHLAYLLALDKLDTADKEYTVVAARLLHNKQKEGYLTSVDLVSIDSTKYNDVVKPCLKYTDYLIINDYEAEQTSGIKIRENNSLKPDNLVKAANKLFEYGVNKMVVIHMPEGGYVRTVSGQSIFSPSFIISKKDIKSTVGAGDSFCAGCLYGLHEKYELKNMLDIANAYASFTIRSNKTVGKTMALSDIKLYIRDAKRRQTII